jgi:hypothetical protein
MKYFFSICIFLLLPSCFKATAQADTLKTSAIAQESFNADAATQAYISTLSPEQKAKSKGKTRILMAMKWKQEQLKETCD